jgi:hypothetical protein
MELENINLTFIEMIENWPSKIILRNQIQLDQFTGGLLCAKTLANHDSKGTGPKVRLKVGRKVAYTVQSLIEWMSERLE